MSGRQLSRVSITPACNLPWTLSQNMLCTKVLLGGQFLCEMAVKMATSSHLELLYDALGYNAASADPLGSDSDFHDFVYGLEDRWVSCLKLFVLEEVLRFQGREYIYMHAYCRCVS